MTTLADKAILSGADNRPPMLEKDMYDSWKSRMELYMLNRQHGRMILESVENGPLIWPSIEENRVTRPKKYSELSATEHNTIGRDQNHESSLQLNNVPSGQCFVYLLAILSFLITAEVLEIYMHQFWNTIKKIRNTNAYNFKLDKKKYRVDTEVFCEILQICLILPNQEFVKLPSKEDLVSFIKELGYSSKCDMLSAIHTDQMHQPLRTFAAIINRASLGKQQDLDG
ncbi:hypothetical protein Tco_0322061 [Tanacetum coccineum]